MVVVVGHEAEAVAAALADRVFHRIASDPDQPMFESIRTGLRAALSIDPKATIVLQPCDQPHVAQSTLDTLTDWSLQRPVQAVIPQLPELRQHVRDLEARLQAIEKKSMPKKAAADRRA